LRLLAKNLLVQEWQYHSVTPTSLAITALRRAKSIEQKWEEMRWENRAHFFSAMARAMRHALVDYARRRQKETSLRVHCAPEEVLPEQLVSMARKKPERIILLEEAMEFIEVNDQRLSDVLDQYYFAGYSIPEMARYTGVSEKSIDRELKRARALLRRTMERLSGIT